MSLLLGFLCCSKEGIPLVRYGRECDWNELAKLIASIAAFSATDNGPVYFGRGEDDHVFVPYRVEGRLFYIACFGFNRKENQSILLILHFIGNAVSTLYPRKLCRYLSEIEQKSAADLHNSTFANTVGDEDGLVNDLEGDKNFEFFEQFFLYRVAELGPSYLRSYILHPLLSYSPYRPLRGSFNILKMDALVWLGKLDTQQQPGGDEAAGMGLRAESVQLTSFLCEAYTWKDGSSACTRDESSLSFEWLELLKAFIHMEVVPKHVDVLSVCNARDNAGVSNESMRNNVEAGENYIGEVSEREKTHIKRVAECTRLCAFRSSSTIVSLANEPALPDEKKEKGMEEKGMLVVSLLEGGLIAVLKLPLLALAHTEEDTVKAKNSGVGSIEETATIHCDQTYLGVSRVLPFNSLQKSWQLTWLYLLDRLGLIFSKATASNNNNNNTEDIPVSAAVIDHFFPLLPSEADADVNGTGDSASAVSSIQKGNHHHHHHHHHCHSHHKKHEQNTSTYLKQAPKNSAFVTPTKENSSGDTVVESIGSNDGPRQQYTYESDVMTPEVGSSSVLMSPQLISDSETACYAPDGTCEHGGVSARESEDLLLDDLPPDDEACNFDS